MEIYFFITWAGGSVHKIMGQNDDKKIEFSYNDGTIISDNNSIILNTNSNERMRINTSGNVGIGSNNPGAKLDVVGTTKISQTLSVAGSKNVVGNSHLGEWASIGSSFTAFGHASITQETELCITSTK